MLRKFYVLFLLLILAHFVPAQSWINLGQAKPDTGYANNCEIASDTAGNALVAFSDGSFNNQISVMQYLNGNWNYLGPKSFTWANAIKPKLLITKSNQIYLTAWYNNGAIKVYRYKPSINDWEGVAFNLATGVTDQYITTCADDSENIYVAFHDEGLNGKVVVKKYDGTNWSDFYLTDTTATYPAIACNKLNGAIYLAYRNTTLFPSYASVVNCTTGNFVGSANISTDAADNIGLAVNSNGTIYISYTRLYASTKTVEVKYYDGTSWVSTPATGISTSVGSGWPVLTNLLILPNNIFLASYNPNGTSTIYKLGANWSTIGTFNGTSNIALSASHQTPLIVYRSSTYPFKFYAYSYGCYLGDPLQISTPDTQVCAGSPVPLSILNSNAFTAPYWSSNGHVIQNTYNYNPIVTTTTTFVAQAYRTCQPYLETDSITIYVDSSYAASITALIGTTFCQGDPATFVAHANLHSATAYQWFKNGFSVPGTAATYQDSTLKDGDKITCNVQGQSCLGKIYVPANTITVHVIDSVAKILLSGSLPLCAGDSIALSVAAISQNYTWSTGDTSNSITVNQAGTYAVNYLEAGCQVAASIDVNVVSDSLPVNFTNQETHYCNGDTITLELTNAYSSTLWNTGDTTSSISVIASGTYSVTVGQGTCSGSASVSLIFDSLATLPLDFPNDTIRACQGDTINLSPLQFFNNYTWSTGESSDEINVTETGNYSLLAERNGCTATDSIAVVFSSLDTPVIYTGNTGTAICTQSGAALYTDSIYETYLWNTGATGRGIIANTPGTYTLTVTANGCSQTAGTTISNYVPSLLTITSHYISYGLTDLQISPKVTGPYFWDVYWNHWGPSPQDQFTIDRDSMRIYCVFAYSNFHNGEISDWVITQGYYLKVIANNHGCIDTSEVFTNQNCITSLHEIPTGPRVTLYPNPSSNLITVEVAEAGEKPVKMEIMDLQGRLIRASELNEPATYGRYTLNISNLANGFYFVRVWIGPEVSTLKLEKVD